MSLRPFRERLGHWATFCPGHPQIMAIARMGRSLVFKKEWWLKTPMRIPNVSKLLIYEAMSTNVWKTNATHITNIYIYWLVVWNVFIFPYIGNVIIPTDYIIFFRGVGRPPTSYLYRYYRYYNHYYDIIPLLMIIPLQSHYRYIINHH